MAKAIRQTLTEISVKLAGPTDADKKLTDIVAKAAAASKALDVYSEKFRDQQVGSPIHCNRTNHAYKSTNVRALLLTY